MNVPTTRSCLPAWTGLPSMYTGFCRAVHLTLSVALYCCLWRLVSTVLACGSAVCSTKAIDLEHWSLDKAKEGGLAVFLMATYGEGE